ncbi:MAG: ACT domain-containing protein [Acidobacteria bacterium]|nr:ACT domain-containing protein [Acidobacteriota bacterium]MBI3427425.1 ACT domain-containing protein [Acidobacteriota bacterium]
MTPRPTEGYSITLRLRLANKPGTLGKVTSAIGMAGGNIGAIDIVEAGSNQLVRDITVAAGNDHHAQEIAAAVNALPDVTVINVSDRVFLLHIGGKIEVKSKIPIQTRADLSRAYTPGVARVCTAIAEDPSKVFNLTIKRNTVAVVTDGTAVLGLGDIGPAAALPVMEGKAMLFKEFAGIDAFPICLDTKDVDEIVRTVKAIAPGFGGINLEDIAAPRCFEVEQRLRKELDIPVFHDDQHGTAVVVLAAAINALKIVGKKMDEIKVVVTGTGAAGTACAKMLRHAGVRNLIGCDLHGVIYHERSEGMNEGLRWWAEETNPDNLRGELKDVIAGADLFLGVSTGGILSVEMVQSMARDPVIFALANPNPEIAPEEAAPFAKVIASGRSDYPNQINNVLCFPGIFRGALDCRASEINEEMKLAAAYAIANIIADAELDPDYIIPSVFNRRVTPAVAAAVEEAARRSGVARRERTNLDG